MLIIILQNVTTNSTFHRINYSFQNNPKNSSMCANQFRKVCNIILKAKSLLPFNTHKITLLIVDTYFFRISSFFPLVSSIMWDTIHFIENWRNSKSRSFDIVTKQYLQSVIQLTYPPTNYEITSRNIQETQIQLWLKKWKMKTSEEKSVQMTFTTRRKTAPPSTLNGRAQMRHAEQTKHAFRPKNNMAGSHSNIPYKRKQLGAKIKTLLYWMIAWQLQVAIENKLLI